MFGVHCGCASSNSIGSLNLNYSAFNLLPWFAQLSTEDRFKNRLKSFGTDDDWVSSRVDNQHDRFWEQPEYFFDAMQSKRRLKTRTNENALKLKWLKLLSLANWPAFCPYTFNEPIEHTLEQLLPEFDRSEFIYIVDIFNYTMNSLCVEWWKKKNNWILERWFPLNLRPLDTRDYVNKWAN